MGKKLTAEENAMLLSLSEDIATIRHRNDLWRVMMEKIKPLVNFDDAVLLILNEDLTEYSFVLTMSPAERQAHELYPWVIGPNRVADSPVPWYLARPTDLFVQDLQLLEDDPGFPSNDPAVRMMKETGLWCSVVHRLRWSADLVGLLAFHYGHRAQIQETKLSLYKAIANQVSIAVANILANEEIVEREQQKTQLLKISEAIATIRDRNELFTVIVNRVKPLFRAEDVTALFVVEKEKQQYRLWLHESDDYQNVSAQALKAPQSLIGDPVAEDIMKRKTSFILTLKEAQVKYNNHLGVQALREAGYLQVMVVPLRVGGHVLGWFNVHSKRLEHFTAEMLPTFQSVGDQIAIAVANILANEEILEREREKALLLSLSEDMATIRDREDLWKVVINKIYPITGHNNAHITILSADGERASLLLQHHDESIQSTTEYQAQQSRWFPVKNSPFETALQCEYPTVFSRGDYMKKYAGGWEMQIWEKAGIEASIEVQLKWHNRVIGLFTMLSKTQTGFDNTDRSLIKSIADQVSIAVANILANEEILKREQEKSILLSLSEDIATVRGWNELFNLLAIHIKCVLPFYSNPHITVLNADKQTARFLVFEASPDATLKTALPTYRYQSFVFEGTPFEEGLFVAKPTVFHKAYFQEHYPDYWGTKFWEQVGIEEALSIPLRQGGRLLGALFLHGHSVNSFADFSIRMAQAIGDSIAVAVANILANEEILEREREKGQLLEIGEAIATIRNSSELLTVILDKITPLIKASHLVGLFTVLPDKQHYKTWFTRNDSAEAAEAVHASKDWVVRIDQDPLAQDILWHAKGAYFGSLEYFIERYPHHPGVEVMRLAGMQQALIIPLRVAGQVIGCINFHSEQADQFSLQHMPLYQAVADQVAVAVANILANEDIHRREQEKEALLKLSHELAQAKTMSGVCRLMFQRVKSLIQAEAIVLTLLSKDKKSYVAIDHESEEQKLKAYQDDPLYEKGFGKYIPIDADPFLSGDKVFEKVEPYYVNVRDVLNRYPDHIWAQLMYNAGSYSTTSYVLRVGSEIVGALFWHWKEELTDPTIFFPLIKGVGDQVAVSIANILSSEEILQKAAEIERLNQQLLQQNSYLIEEVKTTYNFEEIIGQSQALKEVFKSIDLVAKTDSSVLIMGETGTGKELIARAIHNASTRAGKTLIKLNCASLPPQLVESELFGHERGAFTGAIERRVGKFEIAAGSTLFLDEIGELPLELQAKLLRVLQEMEIERLGSNKVIKVDVRIIAATNRDLVSEVREGRFRQDLYYRLNVFPVFLPPLRERKEDIGELVAHFVTKYSRKVGRSIQSVSAKCVNELIAYQWPGNIRELEHVIERSVIMCNDKTLRAVALPALKERNAKTGDNSTLLPLADAEKEHILKALSACSHKISGPGGAAELLNINPHTLIARMEKLGIKKKKEFS